MDLKHIHSLDNLVEIGMNLKDYYPSGEWDILDVPAERHARFYECCPNEFYAGNLLFLIIKTVMIMIITDSQIVAVLVSYRMKSKLLLLILVI